MYFHAIANTIFEMRTAWLGYALETTGYVAVLLDCHGISRWPNGWTVSAKIRKPCFLRSNYHFKFCLDLRAGLTMARN